MAKIKTAAVGGDAGETTATAEPIAEAPRHVQPLSAQDIHPMGVAWNQWGVVARAEDQIGDALDPKYLFNGHQKIGPLDYIEIKSPFGMWVVCLDVVRVDRATQSVQSYVREIRNFPEGYVFIKPDLTRALVEFKGSLEWCVVMDHAILKSNFPSQHEARAWLAATRQSIAAV